ncbi:MAG: glycine-rich domain-containing protein [Nannocystaceae bacterium]
MQMSIVTPSPVQTSLLPVEVSKPSGGNLSPDILALELERIVNKLAGQPEWNMTRARQAELAYRRFLQLRSLYPTCSLVPTRDIDEMWHGHILDTRAYAADCDRLFGGFMHHCPAWDGEDRAELDAAFAVTRALWMRAFGEELAEAARCESKACHVDTPCRCR